MSGATGLFHTVCLTISQIHIRSGFKDQATDLSVLFSRLLSGYGLVVRSEMAHDPASPESNTAQKLLAAKRGSLPRVLYIRIDPLEGSPVTI